MTSRSFTTVAVAVWFVLWSGAIWAQTCSCPDPFAEDTAPGIVWRGPEGTLTVSDVAHLLAPMLWLSSDEILLARVPGGQIPQAHPCDRPAAGPVVYYEVLRVLLRGDQQVTGEDDPQFLQKVDSFILKYFFYYSQDVGVGSHTHDLEAAEFEVVLDRSPDGCVQMRLKRVKALAHGIDWYSNILVVEQDTRFPMTLLVEEGKHASCPDRNADGLYTPGYDVNRHVNDAWGVRDVLGSGFLLGSSYSPSQSKPRVQALRVLPPGFRPGQGTACSTLGLVSYEAGTPYYSRYELRAARDVPVCSDMGTPADAKRLTDMMRFHGFGPDVKIAQFGNAVVAELSRQETPFRLLSGVALRGDVGELGVSLQGPGLDLGEFWVVPRVTLVEGLTADVIFTPSASRWADWYVAVGYEHLLPRSKTVDGEKVVTRETFDGFGVEAGYKFRFAVKGTARWLVLGYNFAGVRLGVRTNGYSSLKNFRFIAEIGTGVF